jgi:mycoredoxin
MSKRAATSAAISQSNRMRASIVRRNSSRSSTMPERVTVYGADWCGDTRRTLKQLDQKQIDYTYINIDDDRDGEQKVIEFSKGRRRIPLVEIATDGATKSLAVPSADELDKAMK